MDFNFYDERCTINQFNDETLNKEKYHSVFDQFRDVVYICSKCATKSRRYLIKSNWNIDIIHYNDNGIDISDDISFIATPLIEGVEAHCPRCDSEEMFIPIDSAIVDIIIIFNSIGLKTIYSCQGHFQQDAVTNSYIIFEEGDVVKRAFESIPESDIFWKYWDLLDIDKDNGSVELSCKVHSMSMDDFADGVHIDALRDAANGLRKNQLGLDDQDKKDDKQTS